MLCTTYESYSDRSRTSDLYERNLGHPRTELPTKRTYFHITLQGYEHNSHHFLVPRISEQAANDDVTVTAVTCKTSAHEDPSLGENHLCVTRTVCIPEIQTSSSRRHKHKPMDSVVNIGFSTAMKASGYTECVTITDGPPCQDKSAVTICDFSVDARYKESVNIGPALHPAWFRSHVVCHSTTSKKNYKTSVDYVPKMKPLAYEATQYVRPKHLVTTYVSYLDYVANDSDKWYMTTVQLVPGSNHSNTVHNFQMRQRVDSVSSDDDVISDLDNDVTLFDGDENNGSDVNMNMLNACISLQRFQQPPLLVSSGPDEESDGTLSQCNMSHRTKMVIKSAPPQHMNNEDYVVYLTGYASTGDVITNGYTHNGDLDNGYLSDDVTDV